VLLDYLGKTEHEIRVEINQKRQKNIPDIIDCNLKNDDHILVVFGTSISDTTGHQMTIRVSTSTTTCKNTEQAKYALK